MKLSITENKKDHPEQIMEIKTLRDLGQLIRRYRQKMNVTLDQLAAATGISKPYLSNIENARLVGPPSGNKLALIEQALLITAGELTGHADWLRTPETIRQLMPENPGSPLPRHDSGAVDLDRLLGKAEFSSSSQGTYASPGQSSRNTLDTFPRLVQIPLINRVAAGSPTDFTDLDYPVGVADAYIPAPQQPSPPDQHDPGTRKETGMFALRVEGDSMSPQYLPGDIIVFSTVDSPADGDDCLIRLDEQGNFATTFKRIYFVDAQGRPASDAGFVQLCPLNASHAQRLVSREQITGLYPAVWKITPTSRRVPAETTLIPNTPGATAVPSKTTRRTRRRAVRATNGIKVPLAPPVASITQGFAIEAD